jgi:hypothetical protein
LNTTSVEGGLDGIALVTFALVVPAVAQDQGALPDAARGQALAWRCCGACHLVALRVANIDPPPFTATVNDPTRTPEYLRTFFVGPHTDVPPIQLTAPQIAYFGTPKKP